METNPWPNMIFLKIIVFVWSFLTMLFSLFVVLPLLISKQIENKRWKNGAWDLVVKEQSWFHKKFMNKYNGLSLGWCIIYDKDGYNNLTTRIHERVHLSQQLKFGIFQWIFYALFYAIIYFGTSLDAYAANPFEIDARVQAGQNIGNLIRK